MITFLGIHDKRPWTCIEEPSFRLVIIYRIESGEKRLMRMDEIMKFSTGMLKCVLENVEQMIDQDLCKVAVVEDVDKKVWFGLVSQYVDERLAL
ncbi:hypothetical protein Tco_1460977 [Tanacetum coccineum]